MRSIVLVFDALCKAAKTRVEAFDALDEAVETLRGAERLLDIYKSHFELEIRAFRLSIEILAVVEETIIRLGGRRGGLGIMS